MTQYELPFGLCFLFQEPFEKCSLKELVLRKITEFLQGYMNRFYLINHHDRFIQKYITNVESYMNLVNLINKSLTNEVATKPRWWFMISDPRHIHTQAT